MMSLVFLPQMVGNKHGFSCLAASGSRVLSGVIFESNLPLYMMVLMKSKKAFHSPTVSFKSTIQIIDYLHRKVGLLLLGQQA